MSFILFIQYLWINLLNVMTPYCYHAYCLGQWNVLLTLFPPQKPFGIDSVNLMFVCVGVCECKFPHKAPLASAVSRGLDGERKYYI